MTIDIERLITLANNAPEAPWKADVDNEYGYWVADNQGYEVAGCGHKNIDRDAADFIAAANPATILSLLAELSAARTVVKAAKELSQYSVASTNPAPCDVGDIMKLRRSLTKYEEACK